MPGNLSDLGFGSSRVPRQIVNICSDGTATQFTTNGGVGYNAKQLLSGATTAGVFKTALQITGAGELNFVGLQAKDATARSLRLRLTLDGVVVFDPPATAVSSAGMGLRAVGQENMFGVSQSFPQDAFESIPFNSSALVEIYSSLTETDKLGLLVAYKTY